eukprot:CAMPEP_0202693470 /NCGR_PEP_ID=MMETSP1385-20130828/7582_1 /ASSEMBLY_ACC=CAM_ASM_000861 /TAXON_ID=933848 /ORGANISM="Elphidium margaritaceum" /LENGTH=327 /DNA_ID=CAMNT_0049349151 /DNA_START=27 /DNA_END=1010 /DNA_ORIENTATION=-
MAFCEELELELVALSLYVIMIVVQSFVTYIGLRELFRIHRLNGTSSLSFFSQLFFFATSVVFYIGKILSSICWCFCPSCNSAAYAVAYLAYASHLCCLMLLLYARLRDVFAESVMRISNCLRYSFYVVLIFLISMGIMVLVANFIGESGEFMLARLAECFVVILVVCQLLAWKFVYNLYVIHMKVESGDVKFLVLLRKYAILNLVCVMFTTMYAFTVVIAVAMHTYSYYWSQILTVIIMGDIFVDTLCVALSFGVYEEYYLKCCCLCHYHCPCFLCLKNVKELECERVESPSSQVTLSDSSKNVTKFNVPSSQQDDNNLVIADGQGT